MRTQYDLRQRVHNAETLLGGILRMPNEGLTETAGLVGLDFVIIDSEHGPADDTALQQHLTAAWSVGLEVLVRVGSLRADDIGRILDLGASGIVVPHVSSAAQAHQAVAACHYPPMGGRGLAVYTRAGRYGLADPNEHLRSSAERTLVVAMIEDAAGVASADDISAVDGIDAVLAGPGDLALSLGVVGEPDHPQLKSAITGVRNAVHQADRALMTIVASRQDAQRALESGTQLVVYNLQAMVTGLLTDAGLVR